MNRKEKFIINFLFLIFTIPIIILIIFGYMRIQNIIQKNPLNPIGLEITNCILEENKITFIIRNPTNNSYSLVFTNLRVRGDYASPVIITSGGFLNKIIKIPESSNFILIYDIKSSDVALLNIIRTWKRLGGNVTISLDYEIIPAGGSGVLICKK